MPRFRPTMSHDSDDFEAALEAISGDDLRAVVRDMAEWFDDAMYARFTSALVARAARTTAGWTPEAPGDELVREIESFARAASEEGYAEPFDVDRFLHAGSKAFLARRYEHARRILGALLVPAACGDFFMGQDQFIDEVLGVDAEECVAQYVVAVHMTADPAQRAEAVWAALDETHGVGAFSTPIRRLEQVAVEPLPEFADFARDWRALLEEKVRRRGDPRTFLDEEPWLREIVARTAGPDGLGELARTSRCPRDLRAWCDAYAERGDWAASLSAHDEAATMVGDDRSDCGAFLDGAALAARELGRRDFPIRLARAWRSAPTFERLLRWLGTSNDQRALGRRVRVARTACPPAAGRQRALLDLLAGDYERVAEQLASARGLGWTSPDHPGHLVFPAFVRLLGGSELPILPAGGMDRWSHATGPRLETPSVETLLDRAVHGSPQTSELRERIGAAMRSAAENRIAGVVENKRRGTYGHAAQLAGWCLVVDGSSQTREWYEAIRSRYRRYPALQRELGAAERPGRGRSRGRA